MPFKGLGRSRLAAATRSQYCWLFCIHSSGSLLTQSEVRFREHVCTHEENPRFTLIKLATGTGQGRACLLLAPVFSFSRTGDAHFFTVLGYGSTRDIQPQSFQPFHKLVITERL